MSILRPTIRPLHGGAAGQVAPASRPRTAPLRRWGPYLVGLALLLVWAGMGVLLSLGAVAFLIAGPVLVVVVQLCRRRPLRELSARDPHGLASNRAGKTAVAGGLLLIPAFLILRYEPTWVDNSWIVLLTVLGLAVAYFVLRRALVAVTLTAVLVAVVTWAQTPNLAAGRTGDPVLLAQYHDLAVAEIDLNAAQPLRLAGLGASATTRMEVGSLTKGSAVWSSPTRSSGVS